MRNFDSDVPIELNAEIIWFADVSMQKLSGPLAHTEATPTASDPGFYGHSRP